MIWSRTLGTGHSAITVDDGRLFTLARAGNGRAKLGPWSADEAVMALDAKTGATIWEHRYPARTGYEDFSFGPGPHATPLVVGDRVFTVGTNQQLFAFDKRTGKVIWSHDFVKEFKSPELLLRPNVKTGYGCSPIAFGDTILCSVGGPGQSVMAFRQSDGAVAWKSGDFLTSAAAPILIEMGGRPQAVFLAGGMIAGLDPIERHDPLGASARSRQRPELRHAAVRPGQRAVHVVGVSGRQPRDSVDAARRRDRHRGALVHEPCPVHVPQQHPDRRLRVRHDRRFRTGLSDGAQHQDRRIALAGARLRPREPACRRRQSDRDERRRRSGAGAPLACWRRDPFADEGLQHHDLDGADAGGNHAVREGQRKDRRAGSWRARRRTPAATPAAPPTTRRSAVRAGSAPRASTPAEFSGSWRLDAPASTVTTGAGLSGLHPNGAPAWMFVTQPSNGTLILESANNASQSRFYRPGKSTTTATAGGTITMTTSLVWRHAGCRRSVDDKRRRDHGSKRRCCRGAKTRSSFKSRPATRPAACATCGSPTPARASRGRIRARRRHATSRASG